MDRDRLPGGSGLRADWRDPRPRRAVRVPVPRRALRKLDDSGAGIAVRAGRGAGGVSRNIDFSPGARSLRPDRARRADRDGRQERHPDRRIRQGPARGGHGYPGGRGARRADAVSCGNDDLLCLYSGRLSAGRRAGRRRDQPPQRRHAGLCRHDRGERDRAVRHSNALRRLPEHPRAQRRPLPRFAPASGRCRLGFEPPHEFGHVDDHPGMRPDADLLGALGRPNRELDLAPVDSRCLGLAKDYASDCRRGEMADVDRRSYGALAGVEIGLDRIERGVFHDHDHDRRGENRRQRRVLEAVRQMLGLHEEGEGALCSEGYRLHGFAPSLPGKGSGGHRARYNVGCPCRNDAGNSTSHPRPRYKPAMSWLTNFVLPKIRAVVSRRGVPENLWHKCPGCEQMLFYRELEANLRVCRNCGHHFRIGTEQRLKILFDDGVFTRIELPRTPVDPLRFRDRKRYTDRLKEGQAALGPRSDAVVVAHGRIGGVPAVVAAFEFSFMGGSMGVAAGEAILAAAKLAVLQEAALIVVPASGGARMQEGVLSLVQMPRTIIAAEMVKEAGLPYIVVLTDPTTGGVSASFAMVGDITLAEPRAVIGFAGARVIEETIHEKLPDGFQRAEYLLEHGMVDQAVPRGELRATLGRILGLLRDRQPQAANVLPQAEALPDLSGAE